MASNSESKQRLWLNRGKPLMGSKAPGSQSYRSGLGHKLKTLLLALRVHRDAFSLRPSTYMLAVAWRLRGFNVRSRNMIAPLLGRSREAYALWIARREPARRAGNVGDSAVSVPIAVIVDCRDGTDGLAATLASIAEQGCDVEPVIVGGPAVAGATCIGNVTDFVIPAGAPAIWICAMRPGDRLAPGALALYAGQAISGGSLIYADDDLVDDRGLRRDPHFKPQWNPDLFEHHDFITGACLVFADAELVGRLPERGWAEMLTVEAIGRGPRPTHLPYLLHHRARRPAPLVPSVGARPSAVEQPLVSVIIPTRNQVELLRNCSDGLERADYPCVETIVIDNGSDDPAALDYLESLHAKAKVLRMPGPFNFSRLNNAAVSHAGGELLCFLNNDVEMVDRDWLSWLVAQAVRDEVGAVGARLLYPDGTIQHAGVFTGIGGGAGHGHRFQGADDPGYFERARLPQQVSAVTAACLVVSRAKFDAVGGFDEVEFPVAFNDVDLCLKLNARGWQSFYEPRATLIHHESKSRGRDRSKIKRARFAGELAALKRKWHTDELSDPYHHPELSRFSEQFLVAV